MRTRGIIGPNSASGSLALLLLLGCLANSSATFRYVNLASLNPVSPYLTETTAATSIQDAIDVATSGDVILVSRGAYASGGRGGYTQTSNRVVINKAVFVRSLEGPALTSIVGAPDPETTNGPAALRCVYIAAGAVLDGFTLTNGFTAAETDGLGARGGGAWCEVPAVLTNCVLIGNYSVGDGAGVFSGTLYRCTLTGNSTQQSNNGDGDGGGADHSTLYNCLVTQNRARKGGGVDDCLLYGCIVAANHARVFGGGAARSLLLNCTVVDNHARRGGGVSGVSAVNCIVYHNHARIGPNFAPSDPSGQSTESFDYSCTTPLPDKGGNNIVEDPQLASWSHLSTNSPCLRAGTLTGATPLSDWDGQPFANPPSIGADQLTAGQASGPLTVKVDADFTNVAVGYACRFKLSVEGQTTRTRWDFADGTFATNQLVVEHAWSSPGGYLLKLTAWNDASGGQGITTNLLINVVPSPTAYVNRANQQPQFPFASWATAANKIQDAIGVTNLAGRLVLVTNGTYDSGGAAVWGSMSNRVALTNGVIVRSVNGPQATFLRGAPAPVAGGLGDGAIRCAYVGDGATLDGFTLTNGFTRADGHRSREQGGGGVWSEHRGLITNCVIMSNHSSLDGGGADGGIYYNCRLVGNTAEEDGGAVDDAVLYGCTFSNNVALWGGAVSEAEVHKSTLSANSAVALYPVGGGASDSSLYECVLAGNAAPGGYGGGAWASELFNCIIRENDVGLASGAGAYLSSLRNCTVAHNSNAVAAVDFCTLRNCIIYHNEGVDTGFVWMDHSCSRNAQAGTGNITNEPSFLNLQTHDYHLRPDSPCIDTAVDLSTFPGKDLDGNARPLDGNRDGVAAYDMGAYEFNGLYFTSITAIGNTIRICWGDSRPGVQLQSSVSLDHPLWVNRTISPATNCVTVPRVNNGFFRLLIP